MNYVESKYTRSKIEKAGKVIAEYYEGSNEFEEFIPVVDNWRASHAYPLDVIADLVNDEVKQFDEQNRINVVKRIKRLDSIVGKLRRSKNSGLYRMQDLGGCRIIVQQLDQVYKIAELIQKRLEIEGHSVDKIDDYIEKPRSNSGYRSYHIRVKFHEQSSYDGMFIEIQIRTEQEHIWATSIEIMDATANETLKAGTGNKEYMYFFKLVSAMFSFEEDTPIVEGVPNTKEELVKELNRIERKISIRQILSARNNAIQLTDHAPINADYFLLITDVRKRTISINSYDNTEINEAISEYERYEKNRKTDSLDVVLVSAKNFDTIRQCYPNYFMNTNQFLAKIRDYFDLYNYNDIFSTRNKGVKIADLFYAKPYERNIPKGIKIWEGIGQPDGDLIFCSANAAIMEESYLRFSGIKMKSELLPLDKIGEAYIIQGPAIIAMATGACFYIAEGLSKVITEVECIVIQCKEGVAKDNLLFLLGWLKSNICVWDMFNNLKANSVYVRSCYEHMEMPNPEGILFEQICNSAELILSLEDDFVDVYSKMMNESGEVAQIYVDDFNKKVSELLSYTERILCDHYNLTDEIIDTIDNDLNQKGFFVYNQNQFCNG